MKSIPKYIQSPSGLLNCKFWVSHKSQQVEENLPRDVWCNLLVSINEQALIPTTKYLNVGDKIKLQGFITTHSINNMNQLVLHAKEIEIIN